MTPDQSAFDLVIDLAMQSGLRVWNARRFSVSRTQWAMNGCRVVEATVALETQAVAVRANTHWPTDCTNE